MIKDTLSETLFANGFLTSMLYPLPIEKSLIINVKLMPSEEGLFS